MSEMDKWFHNDSKENTKAVILVAHGLNLLPSKMDELAHFFTFKNCAVLRISLGNNPKEWIYKFSNSYNSALERSKIFNCPLYFLGFSLGALIGIHYIIKNPKHQFKKCVLMAPATHTKFYAKIPAFLYFIFKKGSLPSFNLKDYRDRPKTTFAEYQEIRAIQKEIKISLTKNELHIPTLVIFAPKDELINSSKLVSFASSNPFWKTLKMANKESRPYRKYHHLMIDSKALGPKEWAKLLNNLTSHFAL